MTYLLTGQKETLLKIQAYINDSPRELQDKANIQKLLQLPKINIFEMKKYADLFEEWPTIQALQGTKK